MKQFADYTHFLVRRMSPNPFSLDLDKAMVLCDPETQEPLADVEVCEVSLKSGTVIEKSIVTSARFCSKKTKHIVVGDTVEFNAFYEGRVDGITHDEDDYRSDVLHIVDVKLTKMGEHFKKPIPTFSETSLHRKNVQAKAWITATIKTERPNFLDEPA